MKLINFKGEKIRGYQNHSINFRDGLTFLIGINGSGKTTVLKLLQGLLTPSYLDLAQIEFSTISVEFTVKEDHFVESICCYKDSHTLTIEYLDSKRNKISNKIPLVLCNVNKYRNERHLVDFEKLNRVISDFDDLEAVRKIKDLRTPLFLGLNRRIVENNNLHPIESEFIYRRKIQQIELLSDSVDNALYEIQEMFHNNIRRTAQSQFKLSDLFKRQVFEEAFKVEKNISITDIDYKAELSNLDIRQKSLNDVVQNLDVKDLMTRFSSYFNGMKDVLKILTQTSGLKEDRTPNPAYYNALLEWMINRSQLDKIDKIIKYAEAYANNIQNLKAPINRFTNSVNLFFEESGKEIEVDERGEIKIRFKNNQKNNSIFDLSSGEKQLILLFAHIVFFKPSRDTYIAIIDEPELSLHISWQEIFIDALLQASPETQFIIATHAPAILAKPERKEMCEDLTKFQKWE
ncbi:AAA family ATPase [Ihuprevotella massiliensis]|uniref:AAA family ATPase n=1 Tax=Ihuprevotella massiliensis TaxID=1852368 RepID=UPI00094E54A6